MILRTEKEKDSYATAVRKAVCIHNDFATAAGKVERETEKDKDNAERR